MPAPKGKKVNLKLKEPVEDIVKVSEDKANDEAAEADAPVVKSRAVAKKGKVVDSQKGETLELDNVEVKNGKGDHNDEEVDKSVPKPRGRPGGKKTTAGLAKESESNGEADDIEPPKKISKKGGAGKKEIDDASEEKELEAVKPKKAAKKDKALPKSEEVDEIEEVPRPKVSQKRGVQTKTEETVSSRRGGDRAVKKAKEVDEPEEKAPAKKGRSGKAKNGAEQLSKIEDKSKEAKKRGRPIKKGKAETESDDCSDTSEISEKPHMVAIEHCKS